MPFENFKRGCQPLHKINTTKIQSLLYVCQEVLILFYFIDNEKVGFILNIIFTILL